MFQSLALISATSVPFSAAAFNSGFYNGKSSRKTFIHAAVAGAPAVLERKRPASLYEVLRVKENASVKEIKAAYRNLAKLYHPDAAARPPEEFPDDRKFIEIHDAYTTLSDPSARTLYDLKLSVGSRRRRMNGSGYYPTRRWETDQCW